MCFERGHRFEPRSTPVTFSGHVVLVKCFLCRFFEFDAKRWGRNRSLAGCAAPDLECDFVSAGRIAACAPHDCGQRRFCVDVSLLGREIVPDIAARSMGKWESGGVGGFRETLSLVCVWAPTGARKLRCEYCSQHRQSWDTPSGFPGIWHAYSLMASTRSSTLYCPVPSSSPYSSRFPRSN
jgi:hypothetical protein